MVFKKQCMSTSMVFFFFNFLFSSLEFGFWLCPLQQIVSNGTFEFVVVNVLFVTDSPIDGKPCDELEFCGPCVVFVVQRPVFELQKRLIAVDT